MRQREFNWLKLKENFSIIAETMAIEIEAKLKLARRSGGVGSHRQVIERLKKLGAEFVSEQIQKDYYFDDENGTLTRADKCLRLRRQQIGNDEKVFLTYKGAREKARYKRRQETNIEVSDAVAVERLLSGIRFNKVLTVEKKRSVWRLGGCEVGLDSAALLGDFVEIEGPSEEKIADVQKKLGLSDLPHISESYAVMVREKIGRRK
jgi:predicted adenylyl cyclase CyaB